MKNINKPVIIIAEAGVNHNGSEKLAFELIDKAHAAGVDIVKFQTFKAENLVTKSAELAQYQQENGVQEVSQLEMLTKLQLSYAGYHRLVHYCDKRGIKFLSTAFDFESLYFLVNDLKLTLLKIPSGEITNAPFVLAHALTNCKLIVSTGMCTLSEVKDALSVIAFGLMQAEGYLLELLPNKANFSHAFQLPLAQQLLKNKVTLLHCTTEYPAPPEAINLKAMDTLSATFGLVIGYSDHSQGIVVPIGAVARGAMLIEKHFTLDKNMIGPDHKASLEPDELTAMVKSIRIMEQALGDEEKVPADCEIKNISVARKSLVATTNIKKGQSFSDKNITMKRPGDGMSPYLYWSLLSQYASRDYHEGELIDE